MPKVTQRFRLLHGRAVIGRGENQRVYQAVPNGEKPVIETEHDLLSFNTPGVPPKFELADLPAAGGAFSTLEEEEAALENRLASIKNQKLKRDGKGTPAPAGPPTPPEATGKPSTIPGARAAEKDALEGHTVTELRDIAAEEEVDLTGLHLKDDIVNAILASRKSSK